MDAHRLGRWVVPHTPPRRWPAGRCAAAGSPCMPPAAPLLLASATALRLTAAPERLPASLVLHLPLSAGPLPAHADARGLQSCHDHFLEPAGAVSGPSAARPYRCCYRKGEAFRCCFQMTPAACPPHTVRQLRRQGPLPTLPSPAAKLAAPGPPRSFASITGKVGCANTVRDLLSGLHASRPASSTLATERSKQRFGAP